MAFHRTWSVPSCRCPECGTTSHRVRNRYSRIIADLPCAGRRIKLHLTVRHFVCYAVHCRLTFR
ncbi:transposase family protein [Agrobacterium pusense]|uniref:transposase family protein n=1 Tax=Agrobacterium pusense TaxID=648995 RepID=UPI00286B7DB4|nr:transposase family protein [Agrobacterium pusense]